jgi:membrane complex biogenesis BtpA family protein
MTRKTARQAVRLFGPRPIIIGVLHLPALPGAPANRLNMPAILDYVLDETRQLVGAGFTALIVENFGDVPFHADHVPAETVAAMTRIVTEVMRTAPKAAVGVNVLRNDATAAVAITAATGAAFIRVNVHTGAYATDQGLLSGRAAETLRLRRSLSCDALILADVHVKHAQPLGQPDLAQAARDTAYRGLADALIVTGTATGTATSFHDVRTVKQAVPDRPVLIGSGVTATTVREALAVADGIIVGSDLRRAGRAGAPLDPKRLRAFAKAASL